MHAVVIYDSKFGNTERIAGAIARGLATVGTVQVQSVDEATRPLQTRPELLLIGGPTQRRNMSPGLRDFVDDLSAESLATLQAASFDTRYRGSTMFMGSAAAEAAKRIGKAGAHLVAPPESFFIARGGPLERQGLEAGEIERAEAWGRALATALT